MSEHITRCSDESLRRLLQSDGVSEALRDSVRHLDECSDCQTRLEELAAENAEWRVARDSLSDHEGGEGGLALQQREKDGRLRGQSRWHFDSPAWTESMSRQLLSPPSHPEMLGRIGRYEVERLIGAGGMGVVFKAFDTELNRPVAVKVLAPGLAGSGAARKRFAREARAAAAVVHEHVVSIHNVETDGASPFLVMHYVAGESLQGRLDREGPLDVCEILRIGMQTAAGLAAAHAQGLVHRDVKPSNILLERGVERALLTDFGLARASDDASLTHTGFHPGTPQYMSPEQARCEPVDARSDLFSLGSVIYTMCTGRPPFRAETSYGILRRTTDTEPRSIREINASLPEWLERLVGRLHAKAPEDRCGSAEEVHALLEDCLAHLQQPATRPLPAALQSHSRFGAARRRLAQRGGFASRASRRSPRFWAIFASSLVAAGLLFGTLAAVGWLPANRTSEPNLHEGLASPSGRNASPPEGRPPASPLSDPVTQWNANVNEIESYRDELAPLEARSQNVWDVLEPNWSDDDE